MIHIALGVRNLDNYIVHSLVCIYSVLHNASQPVHIHLIHDDTVNPENKKCCTTLAEHFGATLTFHAVSISTNDSLMHLVPDCFGIGSLYRLFIPHLIAEPYVIYFDSDICCTMDVAAIIAEAERVRDFNLMVVQDAGICREIFSAYIQRHGIDPRIYFNSGFLVFNVQRINEEIPNFFESIVNVIRTTGKLRFSDQDALNLFFLQDSSRKAKAGLHYLPERFNLNIGVKDRHQLHPQDLQDSVVHYAYLKPWEKIFPAALLYWKYREQMFEVLKKA